MGGLFCKHLSSKTMATSGFSFKAPESNHPKVVEDSLEKAHLMGASTRDIDAILSASRETQGFGFGGGAPLYYMWYDNRLESYDNWPKSHPMKPESLAGAGFYYMGISDKVKCFWCKTTLHHWEVFDNVLEQHKVHSKGNCNFLKIYFPSKCLQ